MYQMDNRKRIFFATDILQSVSIHMVEGRGQVLGCMLGLLLLSSCNAEYDKLLVSDKVKAQQQSQYQVAYKLVETEPRKAEQLAAQAWAEAQEEKYTKGMADALFLLGMSNDLQGKYGKAVYYHLQSLWYRETIQDKEGIMKSYHNLAIVYQFSDLSVDAELYYQKALDLAIQTNNKEEQAKIYHNTGYLLQGRKEYDRAQRFYTKSLALYREIGTKKYIGYLCNDLGSINEFTSKGNYGAILAYYKESLKINQQADFVEGIGWSLLNIGRTYRNLGQPKTALPYLEKAETILLKDYPNLANTLTAKAKAYLALKNIDAAKEVIIQAESLNGNLKGEGKENMLHIYQLAQEMYKETSPSQYKTYQAKEVQLKKELETIKQAGRIQQRKSQAEVRKAESDFQEVINVTHYWSLVEEKL